MPNVLDANGLQTATRAELIASFTAAMQQIYGPDINLASDTPDGQMLNIYVQAVLDLEDLLVTVYNGMDPDNAVGKVLDQRVAINGIQRQAGTFTETDITVVVSQSVNLYGLDQTSQEIFVVADNAGNRWELQTTQLGVTIGSHVYSFQAAVPGEQLTIPNTITVPVTIVLGVSSVNNPSTYTTLGINEESDVELKIRRQKSVSLASQGYLRGLLAALENITGVTSAFVYENVTSTTDSDGVPGHSIWVIVAGTGADTDIAQAIYTKRNAGCGLFGSTSYVITQVDGSPFVVFWDTVLTRRLFIAFTATSINGITPPQIGAIREGLAEAFVPGVNEDVNINTLGTLVQAIDPNCLVTNAGFSDGETQGFSLSGIAASGTFKVSYDGVESAAINWNDSLATIQTKAQAVTGLSAATVTGSIASQSLVFDLSGVGGVEALLFATANSLQTGALVPITFTYNENYTNVLAPASKRYQFVVVAEDIVITPMQLTPTVTSVAVATGVQFQAFGGYGAYLYAISVNNSGGSINPVTGLYTSGGATGTDTVRATDSFGNTITSTVVVA